MRADHDAFPLRRFNVQEKRIIDLIVPALFVPVHRGIRARVAHEHIDD
jgi:hypothetical protein